jgi:hypothetical protein
VKTLGDSTWTLAAAEDAAAHAVVMVSGVLAVLLLVTGIALCIRAYRELRAARSVQVRVVPQLSTYTRGVAYDVPPSGWLPVRDGTTTLMPVVGAR